MIPAKEAEPEIPRNLGSAPIVLQARELTAA